jgi:hypothetical protein
MVRGDDTRETIDTTRLAEEFIINPNRWEMRVR